MNLYELTYILRSDLDEERVAAAQDRIGARLKDASGELVKSEAWGRRRLAYPIDRVREGFYFTSILRMPGDQCRGFENQMKLVPEVLRFLLIRQEEQNVNLAGSLLPAPPAPRVVSPVPAPPSDEATAAAETTEAAAPATEERAEGAAPEPASSPAAEEGPATQAAAEPDAAVAEAEPGVQASEMPAEAYTETRTVEEAESPAQEEPEVTAPDSAAKPDQEIASLEAPEAEEATPSADAGQSDEAPTSDDGGAGDAEAATVEAQDKG